LFVGDGPDRVELEQFVQSLQLPGVVFAGQRDDVPDLLAISDFAVLPSWHENLPNAILEAMHAAKAVIASAVGGCSEVVEDGSTGILVPPQSPGALAHAIQRLTDAPGLRTRMGLAGRQRIASRFSMTQMTQRLDCVYQEMLAT
jgi:glycosyltransferase involved in cell wall biosynthesis